MGGASYAYDGAGNRISQTVGVDVTQYLLDLQPGLATVLQSTQGSDTTRYLHAQRGIHAQQDTASYGSLDNWTWMLQDGLGSVRSVVDDSLSVLESRLYEPYGTPFGASGTNWSMYGFTGEPTDANELVYLRARYYAPNLGVFTGLDPFEGRWNEPTSINRYVYVHGNPINRYDPTGLQSCFGTDLCDRVTYKSIITADGEIIHLDSSVDFDIFKMGLGEDIFVGQSRPGNIGTNPVPVNQGITNVVTVETYPQPNNAQIFDVAFDATYTSYEEIVQLFRDARIVGVFDAQSTILWREGDGGSLPSLGKTILTLQQAKADLGDAQVDRNPNDTCSDNNKSEPNWVVRGGIAEASDLIKGYALSKKLAGQYGMSVNYIPGGGHTPSELACIHPLFNKQLSYATDTELVQVGLQLGYSITFVPFPSEPAHFNLSVTGVQNLPVKLATELSRIWKIRPKLPNPCSLSR